MITGTIITPTKIPAVHQMSTPQEPEKQSPSIHSLSHLLRQCFHTKNLKATKTLHSLLLRTGFFFTSLNLHTKLILAYTTCTTTTLVTLSTLFNSTNETSPLRWNAVVAAFSHHNLPFLALETFSLIHKTGLCLDNYTLCSGLAASASTRTASFGKPIHAHVLKSGWFSSVYVGTAVVDFYVKLMAIEDAEQVFDEIPTKNTVCINALMTGLAEAKRWMDSIHLLRKMQMLDLHPDDYTLCATLRVCAALSAIELGRQVHSYQIRRMAHLGRDMFIQSALIEMYGKCGLICKARSVFDLGRERKKPDAVLWTSMLSTYSRSGMFEDVIAMFGEMLLEGTQLDGVAFLSVLSACCHTGHVDRGLDYLKSMVRDFGLVPQMEHYSCVVHMLCKSGELDKAWNMVSKIDSVSAWGALLNACKDCGDVDLGMVAAKRALELDPANVGIYVVLSNLYAGAGMWSEIGKLRELMKERGLKKDMGCSWIENTS